MSIQTNKILKNKKILFKKNNYGTQRNAVSKTRKKRKAVTYF